MARDPRGAWVAMPPPHPPPRRRRRPPGAGKARKLESPASSKTQWEMEDVYTTRDGLGGPNSSNGKCQEILARLEHQPANLIGS